MSKLIILLLSLILVSENVHSERILAMVMAPSYSHQMFYQQLWRELAIRGHDIVVVTTDPTNEVLPNFKEISMKESYGPAKEFMKVMLNTSIFQVVIQDKWTEMTTMMSEFQMNLPQVQELVHNKSEHFDLLMIEHFITPALAFQHRFNCPMIGVVSLDALTYSHEVMGNPVHSILYPMSFFPYQEDLSFFERLVSVVFGNAFNYLQLGAVEHLDKLNRGIFGEDTPSISEILERTDMLFVNANPVFSPVRPHTPSTISIAGGMHMKPPKALPEDLKKFLDSATQGAIYFSLGSNVKSNELSSDLRQTIMKTLEQIPYKILWKFENDTLPGKPANVMITKWAPQQDILRHKNIKLFITQGGLQSLEEALYSHVPLVIMPFFGDQQANALKAKSKGMARIVDRHNLNVEDFKKAILDVLENPAYKNTVTRLAKEIQDTPMTPLENAIWWTEYVLRHKGAQHLKGPRIPAYQYYYLDVLAFIAGVFVVILILLFVIVKLTLKGLCSMMKCSRKEKLKTK
ncbi:UDP-glycosyltransferase UGT5-like [Atheta coriaria]|uniref:UDP-glycosyltransferase UGT5-like n=1 Tax=Dalotia coriaria TaxID=877792 RepID=UPI0031F375EF